MSLGVEPAIAAWLQEAGFSAKTSDSAAAAGFHFSLAESNSGVMVQYVHGDSQAGQALDGEEMLKLYQKVLRKMRGTRSNLHPIGCGSLVEPHVHVFT